MPMSSGAWPLPFGAASNASGSSAPSPSGETASSWPGRGAQVRQRPSAMFQQSPQVYWRHVRQKLKVWWNASSWCEVAASSSSLRASAMASENDESSDSTKLRTPFESVRTRPRRDFRGAVDSNV